MSNRQRHGTWVLGSNLRSRTCASKSRTSPQLTPSLLKSSRLLEWTCKIKQNKRATKKKLDCWQLTCYFPTVWSFDCQRFTHNKYIGMLTTSFLSLVTRAADVVNWTSMWRVFKCIQVIVSPWIPEYLPREIDDRSHFRTGALRHRPVHKSFNAPS